MADGRAARIGGKRASDWKGSASWIGKDQNSPPHPRLTRCVGPRTCRFCVFRPLEEGPQDLVILGIPPLFKGPQLALRFLTCPARCLLRFKGTQPIWFCPGVVFHAFAASRPKKGHLILCATRLCQHRRCSRPSPEVPGPRLRLQPPSGPLEAAAGPATPACPCRKNWGNLPSQQLAWNLKGGAGRHLRFEGTPWPVPCALVGA